VPGAVSGGGNATQQNNAVDGLVEVYSKPFGTSVYRKLRWVAKCMPCSERHVGIRVCMPPSSAPQNNSNMYGRLVGAADCQIYNVTLAASSPDSCCC
jgi:hypothetical protein